MFATLTASLLALATISTAAAIPLPGPSGKGTFQLLASTGNWINLYQTGAGTALAVSTTNQTLAPAFKFSQKRGDVHIPIGNNPGPLSITLTNLTEPKSNAPAGYYVVTVDIGKPSEGFTFDAKDGNILFLPIGAEGGLTFAVCPNNSSAFAGTVQEQLFWRAEATAMATVPQCTDVELKAIFNH